MTLCFNTKGKFIDVSIRLYKNSEFSNFILIESKFSDSGPF